MNAQANRTSAVHEPSSLARRIGLGALAIVGTALYAASFRLAAGGGELSGTAWRIGMSAGGSWVAFGVLLLTIGHGTKVEEWVDVCLSTMAIGIAVMFVGIFYNALTPILFAGLGQAPALRGVHFAVLSAADLSMGAWFVTRAGQKGMRTWVSISAWVFGLNAAFVVLMAVLP